MKTRIINSLEGLKTLRDAWVHLEQSAHLPMQEFIWMQACAENLLSDGQLVIVVIEDGGETVAVAPLVDRKNKAGLQLLGVHEMHEPTDVIASSREAAAALAKALLDLGGPLMLRRMPSDSLLPVALNDACRGRGVLVRRPDGGWPGIVLDSRWAEPESQLNSGRRSDYRRALRIAGEAGPVSSEIVTPTPARLGPLLEQAFAVEAAGWKGETKTAMTLDPLRGPFYRSYTAAACEKGILRLAFLRIGDEVAAMQLAVECHGGFWLHKIGFDKKFARSSPGNLLMRETIRYAALRNLKSFEFLGTIEPWVQVWTSLERPCVVLRGYPLSVRGVTRLAGDLGTSALGKFHRLRSSKKSEKPH